MKKILLLADRHHSINKQFAENLEKYSDGKLDITYHSYNDLLFDIGPKTQITIRNKDNQDLSEYDLVYFKRIGQRADMAAAITSYLSHRKRPFIDGAVNRLPKSSKLPEYIELSDTGIPIPHSIFMIPRRIASDYKYLERKLGSPFILKDIHGRKGKYNFLIKNFRQFTVAIRKGKTNSIIYIAQKFIDNDHDYRVLVLGDDISLVIRRARNRQNTHLNNTSRGADATLVPASSLPLAVQKASVAAAQLLDKQVVGVDFVQDKVSNLWYCLEINTGPQLASGTFPEKKQIVLTDYLVKKAGKQ